MFVNSKLFYNSSDRYNFSILWFDLHSNVDSLIKIIYDLLRSICQIHWIEVRIYNIKFHDDYWLEHLELINETSLYAISKILLINIKYN